MSDQNKTGKVEMCRCGEGTARACKESNCRQGISDRFGRVPASPQSGTTEGLGLGRLRAATEARQAVWCEGTSPDLSFRGNELAGEVGEVCNVIKKLERERHGWRGSRDTVEHLAEELADVIICADLVALSAGIDLSSAVRAKFNAKSDEVGIPIKIEGP